MRILVTCLLLLMGFWAAAQNTRCGVYNLPSFASAHRSIETRAEVITIPVIFHLFEEDNADLITDEQIYSQIDVLNQLFNGLTINRSKVPTEYRARIISPQIEFCLSTTTVDGVTILPINRYDVVSDNKADEFNTQGKRSIFYTRSGGADAIDIHHFLNIWVANSQNFAARSSFPSDNLDPNEDGIIIDPDFLGTTDRAALNSPFHLGKTLAHELGHYLGLGHIWGSGAGGNCQNDDGIEDTPLQLNPYRGCIAEILTSCGSTDLTSNVMDFSDDDCLNVFTEDQVQVMRSTLSMFRSELRGDCIDNSPDTFTVYRNDFNMIRVDASCTGTIRLYNFNGQLIEQIERTHIQSPSYIRYPRRGGIYLVELECANSRYIEKIVLE